MTTKNNGDHCDNCGTHWTATNSETLHKINGHWTCDECTCPSVIETN